MKMDFATFKVLLRKLPSLKDEGLLDMFCTAFDSNRDGEIEFREFTVGMSTIFKGTVEDRLRLCFNGFDTDNSGFIEREELDAMLRQIYSLFYGKVPDDLEAKIDNIMDNLDTNPRDNRLSFDEFRGVVVIEPMILRCFMPPKKASELSQSGRPSLVAIATREESPKVQRNTLPKENNSSEKA